MGEGGGEQPSVELLGLYLYRKNDISRKLYHTVDVQVSVTVENKSKTNKELVLFGF